MYIYVEAEKKFSRGMFGELVALNKHFLVKALKNNYKII